MRVRSILTSLIAAGGLGLLIAASPAHAQTSDDLQWRFAPYGVFADTRVILAMVFAVEESTSVEGALGGGSLIYGDPEIGRQAETIPTEDATLLLQAAGVVDQENRASGIRETRACRLWVPATDAGPHPAVALAIGEEIARTFGEFGLDIAPCEFTDSPDAADILVFDSTSVPDIDFTAYTNEGSFLGYDPGPGTGPGGTGGGPAPSATGHGVALDADRWPAILAALAALSVVAGARRLARR